MTPGTRWGSDFVDAARLRGLAAEIRDGGASDDPRGPRGDGAAYWSRVASLLRESYRSLSSALTNVDEMLVRAAPEGTTPSGRPVSG
jgi:hypothetical protein